MASATELCCVTVVQIDPSYGTKEEHDSLFSLLKRSRAGDFKNGESTVVPLSAVKPILPCGASIIRSKPCTNIIDEMWARQSTKDPQTEMKGAMSIRADSMRQYLKASTVISIFHPG